MWQAQVCTLTEVSVHPPVGLGAQIIGGIIYFRAEEIGRYTVNATGFYTGNGLRERKQGYFTVEVQEVKPSRVVLDTHRSGSESDRLQVYGGKTFRVFLYDDKDRPLFFKSADMVVTVKQADKTIGAQSEGSRVWVNNLGASSNTLTAEHKIKLFAFPHSFNQSYELSAVHTPSGLKATYSFTDAGSWEATHTAPLDLPSEVPPERNTTVHPTCEEYAKSPTGLEFSGGSGVEADPLIICTKEQLRSFGNGNRFEDARYCRAAADRCRADLSWGPWKRRIFALLGDSLNFEGERISPIQFEWSEGERVIFSGDMRSISNYVIVDSEQSRMALFRSRFGLPTFKDLIVENPTVRGKDRVAAIAVGKLGTPTASNVSVIGGWCGESAG